MFYFQAFELLDNGRSNGSKPRQAARKCHLKVQKLGSKSKIKISMWRPVVSMQSRFDTSGFDASIHSIRYKLKVISIHIVSIQTSDGRFGCFKPSSSPIKGGKIASYEKRLHLRR